MKCERDSPAVVQCAALERETESGRAQTVEIADDEESAQNKHEQKTAN